MLWFKILSKTGRACNGGKYRYDLPKGGKPGKWTVPIAKPQPCVSGYHVVPAEGVNYWSGLSSQNRLFVVQIRISGNPHALNNNDEKLACEQIRLLREIKKDSRSYHTYRKALNEALKRWDWDNYRGSAQREERWHSLVCGYIERKMGWRKD